MEETSPEEHKGNQIRVEKDQFLVMVSVFAHKFPREVENCKSECGHDEEKQESDRRHQKCDPVDILQNRKDNIRRGASSLRFVRNVEWKAT